MADVVKTKGILSLVASFTDGDDRTITVDNPAATVTGAQVNALGTIAKNNKVLIGDKAGADFKEFKSAKRSSQTTTYYDLTPQG